MQVVVHAGEPTTAAADLLVIGVFQGEAKKLRGLKELDRALGGALSGAIADEDFTGKSKQKLVVHTLGKLRARRVALLGLGKRGELWASAVVNFGGAATRLARDVGAKDVAVALPELDGDGTALAARGAWLGSYSYTIYKSEKANKKDRKVQRVFLMPPEGAPSGKELLRRAEVVGESVALTRDLVNEAPLTLYPETLAARAQAVARASGLSIKVFEPPQLKKMGMNLLLGVGAGSSRPPRLVHLAYEPGGKAKGGKGGKPKPIVLVGKGITFDSGGLSLKTSAGMEDMKTDMAGAATVLSVMRAVAALKPKTPVHGLLALAENMPSGTAIRPGDVIKSAAGKTVEINNTDAEGRLVLADALHYALGLEPRCIVDLATLTGACVVALGVHTAGLFANDDSLADEVLSSAKKAGEHFWRMPLTPMLKDQLKSDVADMKNTGAREGGAITAALFLSEFVGDVPWAHLDIAGPANSRSDYGAESKGGSGIGVATLVEWLAGR